MPTTDRPYLVDLRSFGLTVTQGGTPGARMILISPASRMPDYQREMIQGHRRSILQELEMEAIESRVWDPADGPDPDGMFER